MSLFPRIVAKDPQDVRCFVAKGKALGMLFEVGVTANAAASAPVRHQTIKEALLDAVSLLMEKAEARGSFDWAAHGFEFRPQPDRAERPGYWSRTYSTNDICDLL